MSLGYKHPSWEAHINANGTWNACPGQDNPDTHCSDGDVPSILLSNTSYHIGPYDGVTMKC